MTPVSLLLIGLATKEMEIRDQERRALEAKARVMVEERQSLETKTRVMVEELASIRRSMEEERRTRANELSAFHQALTVASSECSSKTHIVIWHLT
jgi:predicted  nucleic acid-binding Zn-ribbon protein